MSTAQIGDQKAHELSYNHHRGDCADPNPPPGVVAPQTVRWDKVLGYDVKLLERDLLAPGPGGKKISVESWRAPALNCYPLREKLFLGDGNEKIVTHVREVISVMPGEPDATLFQIPAGWTERSPSQVYAEFERRYPAYARGIPPVAVEQDKAYNHHRPATQ
jgi:hypothetical protein